MRQHQSSPPCRVQSVAAAIDVVSSSDEGIKAKPTATPNKNGLGRNLAAQMQDGLGLQGEKATETELQVRGNALPLYDIVSKVVVLQRGSDHS